ncbi:hypothetical protein Acr_21g0003960 [Actinidia rufa]|uniref:Uncharacterized protein n=1 Tax=Actinidia rufa TaxID=165716 RepID=A0A7J0GG50_9ERIC|nr:hypothetical protein Acr_21g0003960 [Actinidia rufa]
MTQILADNRLIKLVQEAGGPSEGRSKRLKDPPQGGQNRKQREYRADLESQSDSNSVAPSARRVSPGRARSSVDLRETINTKLPAGLIGSFHQLTESFVTRFVINTKVSKGVDSFLMLQKGKNESLRNYNKCYWETYNETEERFEELAVVSYKLGLTPGEKLWEDPMLNPPTDL